MGLQAGRHFSWGLDVVCLSLGQFSISITQNISRSCLSLSSLVIFHQAIWIC